jgi:hypothetical protein
MLYIIGITWHAWLSSKWFGFMESHHSGYWVYWPLLLGVLPYYYLLIRKKPTSNFTIFHHWVIPVSLMVALATVSALGDKVLYVGYMSLYGLFYLTGTLEFLENQKLRNNGYLVLGSLGTIIQLLVLSFSDTWSYIRGQQFEFASASTLLSITITLVAATLLVNLIRKKQLDRSKVLSVVFVLFIPIFVIGLSSVSSVVLINGLVLAIGILTISDGARRNHLGVLNFGLLIVTVLVTCRFFDSDLSFVLRGVLFLLVGSGFFVANYLTIKKRQTNEN